MCAIYVYNVIYVNRFIVSSRRTVLRSLGSSLRFQTNVQLLQGREGQEEIDDNSGEERGKGCTRLRRCIPSVRSTVAVRLMVDSLGKDSIGYCEVAVDEWVSKNVWIFKNSKNILTAIRTCQSEYTFCSLCCGSPPERPQPRGNGVHITTPTA